MKINQLDHNYDDFIAKLDMSHIPEERHQFIFIFLYKNSQINLSSIRDPLGVYNKHILDSLELLKLISLDKLNIFDIGTGGGFPLLPLAIRSTNSIFIGVDSIKKKLTAVDDIISDIGLNNCTTKWSRVEDLRPDIDLIHPDIFTIRAVAYVDKLLIWTKNILKKGNKLVLYKLYTPEEYDMMLSLLSSCKLKIICDHRYDLGDDVQRVIYILQKY